MPEEVSERSFSALGDECRRRLETEAKAAHDEHENK